MRPIKPLTKLVPQTLAATAVIAGISAAQAQTPQQLPEIVVQGGTLAAPPKPKERAPAAKAAPSPQPARKAAAAPKQQQPTPPPAAVVVPAEPVDTTLGASGQTVGGVPIENLGTAATVVTASDIKNSGARTATEVLRNLPGVEVNRTGSYAGLTQVRIRGAEANHTLVLIDGIEANSGTDGEFDFSDLSAEDIQQIEVLRGPQSGIYGSKAVGGVINIITKGGRGPLKLEGSVEGGSYGTRDVSARASGGNERGYFSLGVHRRETDGFNVSPARDPFNPAFKDNEDSRLTTFSLKAGGQITRDASVDLVLKNISKEGGRDGNGGTAGTLMTSIDDASRFSTNIFLAGVNARWDMLDGALTHVLRANHNSTRRLDDDATYFSHSENTGTVDKIGYLLTYRFSTPLMIGAKHSISGLLEKQFEEFQPRSDFTTGEDYNRSQIGKVLEYRGEYGNRLFVTGSVRHDDNDSFKDYTTWRTTASLKLPEFGLRPHASIGTGVRYPTFYEQYGFIPGFFTPNPNLKPETSTGWDAGVEFTVIRDKATVDVTYFHADIQDKIVSLGFPYSLTNQAGTAEHQGIEVAGRYKLNRFWSFGLSYTYLDAKDALGKEEVRRAPHSGKADVNYAFDNGRGNLNVAAAYNGETKDTAFRLFSYTPETVTLKDYTLVTVAGSYKLTPNVEMFGRVENAANQKYEESYGYRTPGATAFAGLRFTWQERPLDGGVK